VVVVDEIDGIQAAPLAWAVLEALVRYLPHQLSLVLISRRPVELDFHPIDPHHITWILEEDLAFGTDEVRAVLELAGNPDLRAEEVVRATGGWVTAVVFDARRRPDSGGRIGGVTDLGTAIWPRKSCPRSLTKTSSS
jgi:ATP/maltotriose-dependent transcriptional regulator MalT